MTDANIEEFRKRLIKLEKKQKRRRFLGRLTPGKSGGPRVPWSAFLTVALIFFLLKAFIVLSIGESQYRDQLASYDDPALGQRVGIFIMNPDPITLKIHDLAKPVIEGR